MLDYNLDNENKSSLDNENEKNNSSEIEELDNELTSVNDDFSFFVNASNNAIIKPYVKNNIYYLFIPINIEIEKLKIEYTGNLTEIEGAEIDEENKQITGEFEDESEFTILLDNNKKIKVKIMQSDVPAIFVNLKDGITKDTVNSGLKTTKYGAEVQILDINSKNNLFDSNAEIKGRGNTSWIAPKKSYQIKFNKKQNPFGIGKDKNKKWVLIANHYDDTLIKNKLMNDLCVNSELSSIPNSIFVDLYINSEYIGNYLLCDKIEVNSGRIQLDDEDGGIFELDDSFYHEEEHYFKTPITRDFYALKEAVNEDRAINTINDFRKNLVALENELFAGKTEWNSIKKKIDIDSFIKFYLINEFSKNLDTYFSSKYFYKNGSNDVIHMGPTWDYDKGDFWGDTESDYTLNLYNQNYMRKLYEYPEFAVLVNNTYQNELKEIINKINVSEYADSIIKSSKMNNIVWNKEDKYDKNVNQLNDWVNARKDYFNDRYSYKDANVLYTGHIEERGWDYSRTNGESSGTVGKGLRLEGIRILATDDNGDSIPIKYQTHVQDYGWTKWTSDGKTSGTVGESKRVEAIRIKLADNSKYSVKYRTHIQDYGWSEWKYDGEISGTTGESRRIEAIEIEIVDNINIIGSEEVDDEASISYKGHIQNIGDTGYCKDGEILGTSGRALRLEGLELSLGKNLPSSIGIDIAEHIQDLGWKYKLSEKDYIGTKGQSKRIEALSLKLNGEESEKYSIKYRVHIQDYGWQNWKRDGQVAGTTGKSKRIEAIQIMIEEKQN